MLVLSRKCGEAIIINGNIKVQVIRSSDGRVSLGIEAPDDVPIRRDELQPLETRHHANRDQRPQTRRRRVAG